MKNKTKYFLFIILVLFFTILIFLTDTFFISKNKFKQNPEERFIDESLEHFDYNLDRKEEIDYIEVARKIIKEKEVPIVSTKIILEKEVDIINKENENKIKFGFIPNIFKKYQEKNKNEILSILDNDIFYDFINNIHIFFYKEKGEVRGKMKNKQVKLFGPQYMRDDELISVFIHEFSHYIDIYFLDKKEYSDISNKFYNISWDGTKVIKKGLMQKDFVSGYSMTNKYEDFAESLTYYILHNKDFLEKAKKSQVLKEKYNFFNFFIFNNKRFKDTDFSENNVIKDYYRDITKIEFSRKNFLQYLEKSI